MTRRSRSTVCLPFGLVGTLAVNIHEEHRVGNDTTVLEKPPRFSEDLGFYLCLHTE